MIPLTGVELTILMLWNISVPPQEIEIPTSNDYVVKPITYSMRYAMFSIPIEMSAVFYSKGTLDTKTKPSFCSILLNKHVDWSLGVS